MAHLILYFACVSVAAYQVWRVRRLWAFLLLFVALAPKIAIAAVAGNTTPIRIDDLVVAAALAMWFFGVRFTTDIESADPPSSYATFYLALYLGTAAVSTLLGMAALTTAPMTGVLHAGRLVEYGLLYFFFYAAIGPRDLDAFVAVVRTSLLLIFALWVGQHWTHVPANDLDPSPWATLYPTFSASYDFGGFVMLSTALLYAVWTIGARRDGWTTAALAAGAWLTINSESRISLVGLVVVVAIDIVLRARWWAAAALAVMAATATPLLMRSAKMRRLAAGVFVVASTWQLDAIRQVIAGDPSLALRTRNWRLAIEHWMNRPFFGDGLGGYLAYARQYDLPGSIDGWYLRVLADTGVVGLVAFLLLVAALVWMLARRVRVEADPLRRAIVYGAALAVTAAAVSALLVDTFVSYKIMGAFWTIVACGTRVAADTRT